MLGSNPFRLALATALAACLGACAGSLSLTGDGLQAEWQGKSPVQPAPSQDAPFQRRL